MNFLREFFGNPLKQAQKAEKGMSASPVPPKPPSPRKPVTTPHGFCAACLSQTANEYLDNTGLYNLVGALLMGAGGVPCPVCGSELQRVWFWFFVPIFPMTGQYRVIYFEKRYFSSRYIARRLLTPEDARRSTDPGGQRLKRLRNRVHVAAVILVLVVLLLLLWLTSS